MNPKRARWTLLAVGLSAAAFAQTPTDYSSEESAAIRARQAATVTIPPPIERTRGTTVVVPGKPNPNRMSSTTLPDSGPLNDQPAAVLPAPSQ